MNIQIINHLGTHDAEAQKIAEVGQLYSDIVCAAYELAPGKVKFVSGATKPDVGYFAMGLFLNPDAADALGYHDIDPRGLPYGKAFLSVVPNGVLLHDATGHGASLAGVVMHEIAEMLGDRFANVWAFGKIVDPKKKRRSFGAVAYELCDPVQDAAFTLKSKDGTDVDCSDFVLPSWFNPDTPTTQITSRTGAAKGPFHVASGGYLIVAQESGETQILGRRIGGASQHRLEHAKDEPPAWRTAMQAIPHSRGTRRAKQRNVA